LDGLCRIPGYRYVLHSVGFDAAARLGSCQVAGDGQPGEAGIDIRDDLDRTASDSHTDEHTGQYRDTTTNRYPDVDRDANADGHAHADANRHGYANVDGDANADYQARLTPAPSCYRVRVLKVNELDPSIAGDRACLGSSASPNPGIETAGSTPPTGDSLCADSEWNLRGVVNDARTNASAAVNQGVAIRSLSTDASNACP
jgi:hypothetical protein